MDLGSEAWVRSACAMVVVLVAFFLPWLAKKAQLETVWALIVCLDLAVLLARPVIVFDGRSIGQASKGSIAELLVVASFTFLPIRFCVAVPVLLLGVCGSAVSAYFGGDLMDPLLLALLGVASIYNLALLESRSRRDFRAETRVETVATQVSSEDLPTKSQLPPATLSEADFGLPHCLPSRDGRRHRSLPNQREDRWASAVRKIRTDGHRQHESKATHGKPHARGTRKIGSLDSDMAAFSINVVPSADDSLGSSFFPSQSASVSGFRHGQAGILSVNSSDFRRRQSPNRTSGPHSPPPAPLPRNSLSVSRSSEESPEASGASGFPLVEVASVSCQTDVVWKDGGWHCTRCSKPPAPLPAGEKKPDRRRSTLSKSLASVEAWKKAMSSMAQLQGNWRLVYGPENVSPWLQQFMICGTYVRCEDVDRPIEMVETVHPTLGGGILLLDKDDTLHRFGKTGQHLMFERHDVTNLTALVERIENQDPQWFAQRSQTAEISILPDVVELPEMQDLFDDAEA